MRRHIVTHLFIMALLISSSFLLPSAASARETQKVSAQHAEKRATKTGTKSLAPKETKRGLQRNSKSLKTASYQKKKLQKNSSATRRVAYHSRAARPSTLVAPTLSVGQQLGLHKVDDPLELKSSVAYVIDQNTGQVLYEKNATAVLPIASITKLMTALLTVEAGLPLEEVLEVSAEDWDAEKRTRSRLRFGTKLTRGEALHLALMSSENRAASTLGRTYPGGLQAFVQAMNAKARLLGMYDTEYADPTGLSSRNKSSARDLARLVRVAYQYPIIREYSTSVGYTLPIGTRQENFANTNRLVGHQNWVIGLQKTGFINEAGQCLVMQAMVNDRPTVMVFLDAQGRLSRFGDANRVREWLMTQEPSRHRAVMVTASR